jgi:putative DNA primase/helicase
LREGPIVCTGSGGEHFYALAPADLYLINKQPGFPGVDFLCAGKNGPGRNAVAPGSKTAKGEYKLRQPEIDFDSLPLSAFPVLTPDVIARFVQDDSERMTIGIETPTLSMESDFIAKCKAAEPAVKGSRGFKSLKMAMKAHNFGLPKDIAHQHMREHWLSRWPDPITDAALQTQIEHGYKYARNPFGCETPEAKLAGLILRIEAVATSTVIEETRQRWTEYKAPKGFKLDAAGLHQQMTNSKTGTYWKHISDPIIVSATTSGADGQSMGGLILEVVTDDGIKEVPIARKLLHEDGRQLAQQLADLNFRIVPGEEKSLLTYLGACQPTRKLTAVDRTGWVLVDGQEELVFVFPDGATNPQYRYQPERVSSLKSVVRQSGDLTEWIDSVYGKVQSNPYALYEILKSLSVPLYAFSAVAPGAEHLVGSSTSGKTTLAQIGASVWGCGIDPNLAPEKSFIRTFNQTANALEVTFSQFNDLPVYLDELGTFTGADFAQLIYNATSGSGKSAMNARRDLQKRREWRNLITSTGEVSIRQRTEEKTFGQKRPAKAGQAVRWIDRQISRTTFTTAKEVDAIKDACAKHYGALGPAFIDGVIGRYSVSSFRRQVATLFDAAMNRLLSASPNLSELQRRALRRFALAEVAGDLTVSLGLMPSLNIDQVRQAVDAVVKDWLPASKQLSDERRALQSLREFIIANRDTRFRGVKEVEGIDQQKSDIAGEPVRREWAGVWRYPDADRLFIFPQAIAEATGLDPKVVAQELDRFGWLIRGSDNRLQQRCPRIDGVQLWSYAIKTAFLEADEEDQDQQLTWEDVS